MVERADNSNKFGWVKELAIPAAALAFGIWGGYNAAGKEAYQTFVTKDELKTLVSHIDEQTRSLTEIKVAISRIEANQGIANGARK